METIYNARITDTKLGFEDHDNLTLCLYTEFDGACCGFGGCSFGRKVDIWDEKILEVTGIEYVSYPYTSELLMRILDVIGVRNWEDIKGQLIRVKTNGLKSCAGKILAIGNILEDKWFNLEEFYLSKENN